MNIRVGFDGSDASEGLAKLTNDLEKFGSNTESVFEKFAKISDTIGSFSSALNSVAGLGGLTALAGKLIDIGTAFSTMTANLSASFGSIGNFGYEVAISANEAGISIDQLSNSIIQLGRNGLSMESALRAIENISKIDFKFGGAGKGAEFLVNVMQELAGSFKSNDESLQALQARGVDVFGKIAEQMGITADKVRELSKAGKLSAVESQVGIQGALENSPASGSAGSGFASDGTIVGDFNALYGGLKRFIVPKKSVFEMAGSDQGAWEDFAKLTAEEEAALQKRLDEIRRTNFVTDSFNKLAKKFNAEMVTETEKLQELIDNLETGIASAAGLNLDPAAQKNLETIRNYQKMLQEKLADAEQEKAFAQIDAIESQIEEQKKAAQEQEKLMREAQQRWETSFMSVATESEKLSYNMANGMRKLQEAMASGDQFQTAVEERKIGKMAAGLLNGIPEVKQVDPFAGVSLAGSQEAYRDRIMSQFPPEVRSVQDRMAEALDKIEETSREQLQLEEEALKALQGQGGPKLARML
jgi:tape measure domain-containing protein